MLMNFGKEYVSITLKLVMYASIYKPTKEIKVGLFTKESCDLFKCKKNDIEELEVRF